MTRTDQPGAVRKERGDVRTPLATGVAILALGALLFGPSLISRGPWHVDELRYAEVTRQMGEYGDLLVPQVNGGVYTEKPPAFFWLALPFARVTGDYLVATRLVAAISVVLAAWLLVPLGTVLCRSRGAGALGALLFLTTAMAISRGEQGFIDSLLVSFATGATAALLLSAGAEGPRARWGFAALAALLLAGGTLTKGPVGILCPLIGALVAGPIARGRRGVAPFPLVASVLVAGALAALWLVLAGGRAGWWYADQMLFAQSADRAVEAKAHARPATYYLLSVLKHLLPWTLILPGAVWLAWRRRTTASGRGALAALAWGVVGIVVFSFFSSKRTGYVFPFFPPFALVLGWALWRYGPVDRFFRNPPADRLPFRLLAFLLVAAGAALALLPVLAPLGPKLTSGRDALLAEHLRDGITLGVGAVAVAAGVATVLAGVAALRALSTGGVRRATVAVAFGIGIALAGVHAAVIPSLDEGQSPAAFGRALARAETPDEPYVLLGGHLDGRVHYYTGARRYEWVFPSELFRIADRPGRIRVVADARWWAYVPEEVRNRFVLLLDSRIANRDWDVWRELDLPAVVTIGDAPEDLPGPVVVVEVLADGRTTLDGREIDLEDLPGLLRPTADSLRDTDHLSSPSEVKFVVRAERLVPWRTTVGVLAAAAHPENRIWRTFFVVRPRDGGPPGTFAMFLPRDPGISDGPWFEGRLVTLSADAGSSAAPDQLYGAIAGAEAVPVVLDAEAGLATGLVIECLDALVAAGSSDVHLSGRLAFGPAPAVGKTSFGIRIDGVPVDPADARRRPAGARILGLAGVTDPSIGEIDVGGLDHVDHRALPDLDRLAALAGADGSWGGSSRRTGLVLLAFLRSGVTHRSGPHRKLVRSGLRYLKQMQLPDGRIGGDDAVAHVFATAALVEAYDRSRSPLFKQSARAAVIRLVTLEPAGLAAEVRARALLTAADAEFDLPGEALTAARALLDGEPPAFTEPADEGARIAWGILRMVDPEGYGRLPR